MLLPLIIAGEQIIRAWKWRQLLFDIRLVRTLRLFAAIMAGYFATIIIPFGISPLIRSWLVARRESLTVAAVLATAAIDRIVDGVIFSGFVAAALVFAAAPDPEGTIRLGLMTAGGGSFILFVLLLVLLARFKAGRAVPGSKLAMGLVGRLPDRMAEPVRRFLSAFVTGILWPRSALRGVGILLASAVMKISAMTHFLWAGLAFGVVLNQADYLFLMVFLGFLHIFIHFTRIPGGVTLGAIFALELLGVAEEQALAMALIVQATAMLAVTVIGAVALWRSGVALDDLRKVSAQA
ncbi:MAG: lysylphosphatidylglycerol synthase domain-containing protein [Alphaproteobacteria bacterium]